MTELIDVVQLQEVGDALVDLFEIEVRGEILYLYGGLDGTGAVVKFADDTGTLQDYFEFPIEVEGLDWTSDGAAARPTLRIANVLSLVGLMNDNGSGIYDADFLGIIKNEDLLGSKVTRRRTMVKHLDTVGTPIEFPRQIFILDRVAAENNIVVEFELASPFDVEGVKLPSRIVVGKYCPWKYQGATDDTPKGACTWPQASRGLFLDVNDNVITGWVAWPTGDPYVVDDKVKHGNFIYECIRAHTGKEPVKHPAYWKRIDLCGKTIASCKARFQNTGNTEIPLPFGGFPGSRKFK